MEPAPGVLRGVVFDVDGTLADTERDGHRPAFNRAFAEYGLGLRWDEVTYGGLLDLTGGQRRIEGFLGANGHADPAGFARVLHRSKTEHFLQWVRTGPVRCRPGVDALLADLRRAGVVLGVATTGRRAWVLPLLDRLFGLDTFAVVVTGDDVSHLKPAPDAYGLALQRLDLPPSHVVAVEDSPQGLASARAAGLECVVVTNDYTRDGRFPEAALLLDGFRDLDVPALESVLDGTPGPS